jgi:sterol desaturase/sphingolipid hydroxylase (fatty acid hydroxylase superfamily)
MPFARALIHYGLQPSLLIGSVWLVVALGDAEAAYPIALVGSLGLLCALERWQPARPEWRQTTREFLTTLGLVSFIITIAGALVYAYQAELGPTLAEFRARHGLDVWPRRWPLAAQIPLAFFTSEFFWYWLHRAEHRFGWVWRASGHGAHHSFQHLGAIHFSANHPFELALLLLPMACVELLLGAGPAAAGASVLLLANTTIAHTNLDLNTRGIGWVFTTNRYHVHHHSRVLEESNTNYGCAVILWDRIFGTFADAPTTATGIGDTEPRLLGKMLLPFRQPEDTAVAPG